MAVSIKTLVFHQQSFRHNWRVPLLAWSHCWNNYLNYFVLIRFVWMVGLIDCHVISNQFGIHSLSVQMIKKLLNTLHNLFQRSAYHHQQHMKSIRRFLRNLYLGNYTFNWQNDNTNNFNICKSTPQLKSGAREMVLSIKEIVWMEWRNHVI